MVILQSSNMLALVLGSLVFCSCLLYRETSMAAAATLTRSLEGNDNNSAGKLMSPLQTKQGFNFNKRPERSIYGLGPRMLEISHSKIPIELDLLVENDDDERSKRFDDYGHMRFGKRGGKDQFDDYGHMRFGRSV